MSSIALKFTSLAIRTISKPIGNYIKRQAREHPGFRKVCISFAQSLHRVDMRWRIGLLQDSAAIERQIQRDAAKEAAKKSKSTVPTVKTEAQTKADEASAAKEAAADSAAEEADKHRTKPKIRPLSEAKAIESGANFISETFLFAVAAGLILFETWRSRRKESSRRDVVKDRLDDLEESERAARKALLELEREVLELRAKHPELAQPERKRILPKEVYEPSPSENDDSLDEVSKGWFARLATYIGSKEEKIVEQVQNIETSVIKSTTKADGGEAEESEEVQGPAAKILAESDRVLDARHKQQAEDDAAADAAEAAAKSKRKNVLQR